MMGPSPPSHLALADAYGPDASPPLPSLNDLTWLLWMLMAQARSSGSWRRVAVALREGEGA